MLDYYYLLLRKGIHTCCFLLLTGVCAYGQNAISGKITSEKDQSTLPRATVTVKVTSNIVFSNDNGDYSINAPGNAILVFTFSNCN